MMLRRLAPWLLLFEMLRAGRAHWDRLDPADRHQVADIMRRSKGDPRRLTAADRAELRALARRMHLVRLAASMGGAAAAPRATAGSALGDLGRLDVEKVLRATGCALHRRKVADRCDPHPDRAEVHEVRVAAQLRIGGSARRVDQQIEVTLVRDQRE